MRQLCSLLLLLVPVYGDSVDIDLKVDRTGWLDPNDPLSSSHHCTKYDNVELHRCSNELEICRKSNPSQEATGYGRLTVTTDPTLKHIVRSLLAKIDANFEKANYVQRNVDVYLSEESLSSLIKFLNKNEQSLSERERVREILEQMIVDNHVTPLLERVTKFVRPYIVILNLVIVCPALFILASARLSLRAVIVFIFFASFMISVFNTYNRKLLENYAARMAKSDIFDSSKCQPVGIMSAAVQKIRGLFILSEKSECLQHYEDLYIDPVFQISPLVIISDVLSDFIFTPLGVFGHHFNKFCTEFYKDSPIYIIAIKFLMFCFVFVSLFFWLCGYRLRTIFATLEPSGISNNQQALSVINPARKNDLITWLATENELLPFRRKQKFRQKRSVSASRITF